MLLHFSMFLGNFIVLDNNKVVLYDKIKYMASFKENGTITDLQHFSEEVYSSKNDRLYSTQDLVIHIQRFMMRALKGIRRDDPEMLKTNLVMALAWFTAVCNRLHVNIEEEVWKRFHYVCSYCAHKPCVCKTLKPKSRVITKPDPSLKPRTMRDFQHMHAEIYPPTSYNVFEAGVHAGEEVGEIAEAVHNYLGQHKDELFDQVRLELADFISCLFDVANSIKMDVAHELSVAFTENCHVCHKAPCICSFDEVAEFKV